MKIICIGRNYADHAKEMKSELPVEPIFFLKPDTAVLKGDILYFPEFTKDLHHEIEVIVKISKMGKHISKEHANKYYEQIGLGIDFTARDVQRKCKEKGLPWEKAKAFDQSAVVSSNFINKEELDLSHLEFSIEINEQIKQTGNTKNMIFTIDELISYISQFITLKVGDLLFTGTPEGVGPVQIGDKISGKMGDQEMFSIHIK